MCPPRSRGRVVARPPPNLGGMPIRPDDYDAAPDPRASWAGAGSEPVTHDWLAAVTGGETGGSTGVGGSTGAAGSAGGTGVGRSAGSAGAVGSAGAAGADSSPEISYVDGSTREVRTPPGTTPASASPVSSPAAGSTATGGATGGDLWGASTARARIGAGMHLAVRIGRWLTLALVVSFVVGVVFFMWITDHDRELPLDGTPTTMTVAQGRDVWVWAPEETPAVRCTAQNADGLALRDRPILRSLTSDDHSAMWAVSGGGDGTVEIACEPDPGGQLAAPEATDTVRLSESPSSVEMSAYTWFAGIAVRFVPWVAGATAVLWLVWGVLRLTKVLPPRVRRRERRNRRAGSERKPWIDATGFVH